MPKTIKKHKKTAVLLAAVLSMVMLPARVRAAVPYQCYSYDYYGNEKPEPAPYTVTAVWQGSGAEAGGLSEPGDLFVTEERIYIADSGNDRILVLKQDFSLDFVIDGFRGTEEGEPETLNHPQGIYVTQEGHIYVADTYNGRILEYDRQGRSLRSIGRPRTALLSGAFDYRPMKLAVDGAGRIFISAYGVNLGLIELDADGEFRTFIGAIDVTVGAVEYIWKHYLSTQDQRDRMTASIPTEYSNIFMDGQDFIYAVISTLSEEQIRQGADMVRRLNPSGRDVLRRLGNMPVTGDGDQEEPCRFVDITALESGTYFVLDSSRGKIYCYDYDGNLMYVFGGTGNRRGNFKQPSAIGARDGGRQLLVLDSGNNALYVFTATEYGAGILEALEAGNSGSMEEAARAWERVWKLNTNNAYAGVGIGRYYLQNGELQKAMEYFKNANNRTYYSKAYELYRKELMQRSFGIYVSVGAAGILILWSAVRIRRFNRKVRRTNGNWEMS
ncbi:MAG: NHL repeat-containing protein [Acetatifactor sp.]|nr:NHL repeat-containing protein [Acetatifactor sp.]